MRPASARADSVAWTRRNRTASPTFSSYSFYDVFYSQQQILEGQKPGVDPSLFKDRIVIVGATAEGVKDMFTTPFPARRHQRPRGPRQPGRRASCRAARSRAIAGVGHGRTRRSPAAASSALPALFLNAWSTARWSRWPRRCSRGRRWRWFARGIWIPMTVPTLTLILAFVGDLAWKYFVEGREKRQVKKLFSRYVSKDVYDQLVANPVAGRARRRAPAHDRAVLGHARLHDDVGEGIAGGGRQPAERAFHADGRRGVRPSRHGRQVRRRHGDGAVRRAAGRRRITPSTRCRPRWR